MKLEVDVEADMRRFRLQTSIDCSSFELRPACGGVHRSDGRV